MWLFISALMFGVISKAASAKPSTPHGIDLKNPFTMSKTQATANAIALPLLKAADLMILITGCLLEWWSLSGSNR
uniref:hypothetical protein n=1 Tax=Sphingomonas sp. BE123 TaxID=2817842 RepID=UPI00286AE96C|nr:hypothetical protein [Sphingomonas sp. BE123]